MLSSARTLTRLAVIGALLTTGISMNVALPAAR